MVLFRKDTITIFNKQVEAGKDVIYRTVIKGVDFQNNVLQTIVSNNIQVGHNTLIFIDKAGYLPPKAYAKLENKSGYFTLNTGDKIVKGEIPAISSLKDLNEYDYVVTVKAVLETSSHLEVTGA